MTNTANLIYLAQAAKNANPVLAPMPNPVEHAPNPAEQMAAQVAQLGLKDNHYQLPDIGWFPLTPAWWVLLSLVGLAVLYGIVSWRRRKQRLRPLQQALQELQQIERQYANEPALMAQSISVLLRRVAMSQYGRERVAGLSGLAWLDFLQRSGAKLSPELQRSLLDAPYAAQVDIDHQQWLALARQWIQVQSTRSKEQQAVLATIKDRQSEHV